MHDFDRALYEGTVVAFGKILSKYNVFAQGAILREAGKELADYLRERGFWIEENRKPAEEAAFDPSIAENTKLLEVAAKRADKLEQSQLELHRSAAELLEAREAAVQAMHAESEFLANMSHEIRTPMNAVVGTTELLRATRLSIEQREYVDTIGKSGDALLAVINDILDLSMIEAGKMDIETVDIDVQELLEGIVDLLSPNVGEKRLDFAATVAAEVPTKLRGDPVRLRQVLVNLTANALKFTPAGYVLLRADLDAADGDAVEVRFSVSDSGVGISADQQQRLLGPCSPANGSATRNFGSTGLGLRLSKRLVKAMGGEISLRSAPDKGSVFSFTLKMNKHPQQVVSAMHILSGGRALVAADSGTMQSVIAEYVRGCGMHASVSTLDLVHSAIDEALERKAAFDLVIIDCNWGDRRCLARVTALMDDPRLARLPVVLIAPSSKHGLPDAALPAVTFKLRRPLHRSDLQHLLSDLQTSTLASKDSDGLVAPTLPTPSASPLRLLVVDDNIVNRKIAMKMLQKLGHRTEAASNGKEALEVLSRCAYDIVFMDCRMPILDGFEATAEIRRLEGRARRTAVVAMTANAQEGTREACLAAGMDDYLSKPAKSADLERVIERWGERSESKPETRPHKKVRALVHALR